MPIFPKDWALKEFVVLMSALIAMTALSIDTMLPALPDIGHSLA
jgi:DHA1 family bicyclomycin/chloramphenicol resistance-like MFS transporter